jgi:hypothetical protein
MPRTPFLSDILGINPLKMKKPPHPSALKEKEVSIY